MCRSILAVRHLSSCPPMQISAGDHCAAMTPLQVHVRLTLSLAVHHGDASQPVRAQWLASAPADASASLALPCPCPAARPWLDCVAASTSSEAMTPALAAERCPASTGGVPLYPHSDAPCADIAW